MAEVQSELVKKLKGRIVDLEAEVKEKDEIIKELLEKLGMKTPDSTVIDLTVHNERELLSKDRAEILLQGCGETTTEIHLGTKSFGADAAKVAALEIQKCQNLEIADLADIIAGRPESEALEVLKALCGALPTTIKVLDLSENALGEKGIRALESTLRSFTELEEVSFYNNGLSELSLKLLAEYLPTGKLKRIHFHNNMSGSGGAVALANILKRCAVLTDVRMSSSRVRPDGGCELIQSIGNHSHLLTKLNLGDSMFGESGAQALSETLPNLPNLEELILRDTGLEEEGLEALIVCLENPEVIPNLKLLDLSVLEIGCEENAERVGAVCSLRKQLKHLRLEEDELETAGTLKLLVGLGNPMSCSLETIDLRTNQIGRVGAKALVEYFLKTPFGKKIELNDNQISSDALKGIEELIKEKPDLLGNLDENEPEMDEDDEDDAEDDLNYISSLLEASLKIS